MLIYTDGSSLYKPIYGALTSGFTSDNVTNATFTYKKVGKVIQFVFTGTTKISFTANIAKQLWNRDILPKPYKTIYFAGADDVTGYISGTTGSLGCVPRSTISANTDLYLCGVYLVNESSDN